jgi:hypothetical protein
MANYHLSFLLPSNHHDHPSLKSSGYDAAHLPPAMLWGCSGGGICHYRTMEPPESTGRGTRTMKTHPLCPHCSGRVKYNDNHHHNEDAMATLRNCHSWTMMPSTYPTEVTPVPPAVMRHANTSRGQYPPLLRRSPRQRLSEPTGKVIKGNNNVCGTMKRQSGLMIDYYYIKQKCKVRGGLLCWDYFVHVKDARVLTCNCHIWHQESSLPTILQVDLFSRIKYHARHCRKSVPPLFIGVDGGTTRLDNPHEPWREVWEKMLRRGRHGNPGPN